MNKKGYFGWGTFGVIIIMLLVLVLFIGFIGYGAAYAFTESTDTIVIKEKWVKYHGQDAKYLVSSQDGEVFQITDSIIKMRFDSSDLYASLNEGDTCNLVLQGWRFPLFSDYRNIIEAKCSPTLYSNSTDYDFYINNGGEE